MLVLAPLLWAAPLPAESTAMAQARAPLRLIRAPEIQTELGLDAEQLQTITQALERWDEPLWRLRDLPAERDGEATRLSQQLKAELQHVLRAGQWTRFEQLLLRAAGWHTLQLPSVVNQLDLTEPQRQSYTNFLSRVSKLSDQSAPALARQEFEWIRTELSNPQRQKLSQLLGRPFDFSHLTVREVKAPELRGVEAWLNSPPLTLASLRGKVVVVDFWTFGCINCQHNLPFYRQWDALLPHSQVVQIGIHTPETAAEHNLERLRQAVKEKHLAYPIAVDNQRENWTAWGNNVWPSVYLIDKQGYVRYWWYGELNWQGAKGEQQLRTRIYQLLDEPSPPTPPAPAVAAPP